MTSVKIKLHYNGDGVAETTTFKWLNNTLEFISIEGVDENFGEYSSLNPDDNVFIDEDDFIMVENYMKICGSKLIDLASNSESTICFKKEVWLDLQPAIVESWLEKDGCTMLRTSTRVEYCNNILPLIMDSNNFNI